MKSLIRVLGYMEPYKYKVALTLGLANHRRLAPLVRRWLRLRGVAENACMMLYGAAGERRAIRDAGEGRRDL